MCRRELTIDVVIQRLNHNHDIILRVTVSVSTSRCFDTMLTTVSVWKRQRDASFVSDTVLVTRGKMCRARHWRKAATVQQWRQIRWIVGNSSACVNVILWYVWYFNKRFSGSVLANLTVYHWVSAYEQKKCRQIWRHTVWKTLWSKQLRNCLDPFQWKRHYSRDTFAN